MECKPLSGGKGCGASLGPIQGGRPKICSDCKVPQALQTTRKAREARAAENVDKLAAAPPPQAKDLVKELQARQPMVCCHL